MTTRVELKSIPHQVRGNERGQSGLWSSLESEVRLLTSKSEGVLLVWVKEVHADN